MIGYKSLKQTLLGCVWGAGLISASAWAGFSISGTQLLDGNGQPFVMRGINHAHTWYTGQTNSAIPNIANTGANLVRVVLSNGTHKEGWVRTPASEVANIITLCKNNRVICMLEVHDTTGYGEKAEATSLAQAAEYWVSLASTLRGQEDYVLINIGNEPFGNSQPADAWVDQHKSAIKTLRDAQLTHTLVVDAPNWGQDWQEVMLNRASEVESADPLSNTLFSVHMYEVYQNYDKIRSYISGFMSRHNLPIIVGEFGADHQGKFVDAASVMRVGEELGVGYIGWSWSGNGSCCTALDIVNNFNPNSLSSWGNTLINGANGIKATARRASIFDGTGSSSSTSGSSSSSSSSSSSTSSSSSSASSSTSGDPGTPRGGSLDFLSMLLLVGVGIGGCISRART